MKPFDDSSAAAEPSNVLKIVSATDRHGNITTYTYGSTEYTFAKDNGTVSEKPLTKVHMPNGHEINFVWSDVDAGSGVKMRITEANDGSGSTYRHVTYGYNTSGMLTSVTTPGGKTTSYAYGSATTAAYYYNISDHTWHEPVADNVLTQITDPRGLSTYIRYVMIASPGVDYKPAVYRIEAPNGQMTEFSPYGAWNSQGVPGGGFEYDTSMYYYLVSSGATGYDYGPGQVVDFARVSSTNYYINNFYLKAYVDGGLYKVDVFQLGDWFYFGDPATEAWSKWYDLDSQNLMTAVDRSYSWSRRYNSTVSGAGITPNRVWANNPTNEYINTTTATYNFLGNPLHQELTSQLVRYNQSGGSPSPITMSTDHAYWGATKYYQKKVTKDQGGRYIGYADYYDSSASTGKKGQTYKIYDQARTTFVENASIPIPDSVPACPSDKYWKYRLEPQSDTYSTKFDYDSKGRAIDAWKIQSVTSTPWIYVRSHTTYGSDTDGSWGQASEVVEDYGGINRTTTNLLYDTLGRAVKVQDATGKVFQTTYDADGAVQCIEKVSGSTSTPIVTYTFGTSGATNGAILSVTDNLSGISQAISYYTSGTFIGQVQSVTETNGPDSYSSAYTYWETGERKTSTHTTQSALGLSDTVKWQYDDYGAFGSDPTKASRAFMTLVNLDSSTGARTSEEFHYLYDSAGRPRQVAFGQTPQSWAPSGGASYYDASHRAATRARSFYDYDSSGHVISTGTWWDTWGGSSYSTSFIRGNECDYETTGLKRSQKTTSRFYNATSGSPNLQRTETYGYDADRDYLTSANYGDGLANATPSWTYDAAGNRASDSTISGTWTYDNLNRMTASPMSSSYDNDILGNRTAIGSGSSGTYYGWDDLNRMTSLQAGGYSNNYAYRADGLRVSKSRHNGSSPTLSTVYRYDGQMGIEDVESTTASGGSITAVTRYALGARGIDAISRTTSSGTAVAYPLYDAHGNNVGLLSKSGSSWSLSDERSYDAWGQVRSGGSTGDQRSRYCANLGHKQDDESGLIYMRARYYEGASGRFISQDRALQGWNWYSYAASDPINRTDKSGNNYMADIQYLFAEFQVVMRMEGIAGIPRLLELIEGVLVRVDLCFGDCARQLQELRDLSATFAKYPAADEMTTRMRAELLNGKRSAAGLSFAQGVVGIIYAMEMNLQLMFLIESGGNPLLN